MPIFTNIVASHPWARRARGLELPRRTRARAIGELAGGLTEGLSGDFSLTGYAADIRSLRNRLTPVEQFMLEPITRVGASPFAPCSSIRALLICRRHPRYRGDSASVKRQWMSCRPTSELRNILSKKLSLPLHGTIISWTSVLICTACRSVPSPLAERGPLANQSRNCFVVFFYLLLHNTTIKSLFMAQLQVK